MDVGAGATTCALPPRLPSARPMDRLALKLRPVRSTSTSWKLSGPVLLRAMAAKPPAVSALMALARPVVIAAMPLPVSTW